MPELKEPLTVCQLVVGEIVAVSVLADLPLQVVADAISILPIINIKTIKHTINSPLKKFIFLFKTLFSLFFAPPPKFHGFYLYLSFYFFKILFFKFLLS